MCLRLSWDGVLFRGQDEETCLLRRMWCVFVLGYKGDGREMYERGGRIEEEGGGKHMRFEPSNGWANLVWFLLSFFLSLLLLLLLSTKMILSINCICNQINRERTLRQKFIKLSLIPFSFFSKKRKRYRVLWWTYWTFHCIHAWLNWSFTWIPLFWNDGRDLVSTKLFFTYNS